MLLDDFVWLKKVEHLMIYLLPITFIQFLWVFFERPVPRLLRVLQLAMLTGGAAILVAPGLDLALLALPAAQVLALSAPAAGVTFVLPFIRRRDPDARLLGVGALVLVMTIASDFIVERNFMVAPRTVVYGFGVFVFGMSLALANRFHRVLRDLDVLRRELEARVDARTRELSTAYAQMEALALRDGLTGLLNRRALLERAQTGLAQARRQRTPFGLAMIDVDHFKAVNDTHGHVVGDLVLRHVSRELITALRASDVVGRWGGEEFLVLLPGADLQEAAAAGERLRAHLQRAVFYSERGPLPVTVSVGVVAVTGGALADAQVDVLIQAADTGLYRAKALGRNRVECGPGAETKPAGAD